MKIVIFYYNRNLSKAKKQLYRFAVTSVACTLIYAKEVSANPFDAPGSKFWSYVKGFAFWACLVMCGIEVIKALNTGDTKAITKIIFKYAVAYGSFSFLPWFFREIDSAFTLIK